MTSGWDESALAWIASMGEDGDWGRRWVLDRPMLKLALVSGAKSALDVGCGEGRFCRMLAAAGVGAVGIDPTRRLIEESVRRHPSGEYRVGRAEALDFPDGAFELVVSYLSLIDIDDAASAIGDMARVLAPGGVALVAHLNGFTTAAEPRGWRFDLSGERRFTFDRYLDVRPQEVSWRGISVVNWHRPLSFYFQSFLAEGLSLQRFDEPEPYGGECDKQDRYRRAPNYCVMVWRKPPA